MDNIIRANDCDLMFLSEHWLTSHEFNVLQNVIENNRRIYLKSSVNPKEQLVGRPYGDVGFIANKVKVVIIYKPIVIVYNRIIRV